MTNAWRYFGALVATNLKASIALRGAFLLRAGFMLLNNLLFFVFWWVLLAEYDSIRGWRLDDIMVLFAISAGGYGIAVVLAGGIRELSQTIVEGELDAFLTQPKSVLVQALCGKTAADGWGDFASAMLLLGLSEHAGLATLGPIVVALVVAAAMFVAAGILFHSLAFWLGRVQNLSQQLWEFMLTFSMYPPSLFGPSVKAILFTVIPAGFVTYLPVELVRNPSPGLALLCVGGAVGFLGLAVVVFHRGLRRYASGSRFGIRV